MNTKKSYLAASTAAALALLAASAHATIVAEDDFTYGDGGLAGQNGGTGWTGAYVQNGDDLLVASGEINSTTDGTQGGAFRTLSTVINTTNLPGGELWMGWDGNVTLSGAFGYIGISPFTGGTEHGIIGSTNGNSTWGMGTGTATNGVAGGLVHVVVRFDLNTNDWEMWTGTAGGTVDVSGPAEVVYNTDINGTDTLRFAVHTGTLQVDNLILATTSAEVGGTGSLDPSISVPGTFTINSNGAPETLAIPITNGGALNNLEVTGAVPGGLDLAFFTVPAGQFPLVVGPGATEDLMVDFDPGMFSDFLEAELVISSTGLPDETVLFDGPVQNPMVSIPGPNDFGPVANGAAVQSFSILVDNDGFSEDLEIIDAIFTDPLGVFTVTHDFGASSIFITAGMQGSIPIEFDPTGLDGGIYPATLTIQTDVEDVEVDVTFEVELVASTNNHLVAWWPMESDSMDFSGNAHHGSDFGTPDYLIAGANANTGTGARFNGTNAIDVLLDEALNPSSFTVTAWACPSAEAPGFASVVTSRFADAGPPQYGYIIYQSNDADWEFWTADPVNGWSFTQAPDASGDVTLSAWTHLAVTYDHTTQTKVLYINGTAVQTDTGVTVGRNFFSDLHLASGADAGDNHFFVGKLDDVAIFRVAHDSIAINSIMTDGVTGFTGETQPPSPNIGQLLITGIEIVASDIVITGTSGITNGEQYHIQSSTTLAAFAPVAGSTFTGGGAIPTVPMSGSEMFIRIAEGSEP